ncbi:MAG: pyridoxamine 5-phosphate oxidase [Bacteroidota bacterium]|jgi:pyridoxamine 5'-phosphate oxidase
MNLHNLRIDYKNHSLSKHDVNSNPIVQFESWFKDAISAEIIDANAFTLCTINEMNKPSCRVVLLKEVNDFGFIFFTNYESRKGKDMENNNNVSIAFHWKELERQVRIEGIAQKISDEESDEYFNSRPRESQIGAWASPQSSVIHNRPVLESRIEFYTKKFKNKTVPRPNNWGGYIVKPETVEFWQGRPSRLHDRIQYEHIDRKWQISRLAP